jgi:hypothetical protein
VIFHSTVLTPVLNTQDPLLARAHFQEALVPLLQACPALTSVAIQGPTLSQFLSAPAFRIEKPLGSCLPASLQLRSLAMAGHLADSVYRELHDVLPRLSHCLMELSISGVHQMSRACTAEQVSGTRQTLHKRVHSEERAEMADLPTLLLPPN